MHKVRPSFVLVTAFWLSLVPARAGCAPDPDGALICGEGKDAVSVFTDTISPSKKLAFGWRTPGGLPSGRNLPSDSVENVLLRLDDGVVLSKLGGEFWSSGQMIANRYEQLAAWSPDSRAVVEVANSRWDSDSFAYYAIDGDKVTKIDLRALVEPVVKAKLPASRREGQSFRVRQNLPVKLDARGHLSFTVMLYVPKQDPILDYAVAVDITRKGGAPAARIASIRRAKVDPRL
jgi:hypothetical protein